MIWLNWKLYCRPFDIMGVLLRYVKRYYVSFKYFMEVSLILRKLGWGRSYLVKCVSMSPNDNFLHDWLYFYQLLDIMQISKKFPLRLRLTYFRRVI